jgi:hypothetical protein
VNILIFFTLKRVMARKVKMQNSVTRINRRMNRAKINKMKMILVICLSFILFRTPYMIYLMPIHSDSVFWECEYFIISFNFYSLSFLMQICIYYCFNKKFRFYFNLLLDFGRGRGLSINNGSIINA